MQKTTTTYFMVWHPITDSSFLKKQPQTTTLSARFLGLKITENSLPCRDGNLEKLSRTIAVWFANTP